VFDSTGVSIQDLAAAAMLYERAQAAGGVPQIRLDN
jgi:ornithine cyclodeaminase/alanine dehydrogenase-like protein (mu-crystallin family)